MKGMKKLNKAIKAEVAKFGIEKISMGDWEWRMDNHSIEYTLLENRMEDIFFLKFVKERFGYKPLNSFMLSLFHEIGHNMTYEDLMESDVIYDFCQAEKNRIEKEMASIETKKQAKKLEYQYFNLPDEIVATAWAVDYMETHEEEIMGMWERIKKEIVEFYEKNLDTEE
jgi:hypothetical protein